MKKKLNSRKKILILNIIFVNNFQNWIEFSLVYIKVYFYICKSLEIRRLGPISLSHFFCHTFLSNFLATLFFVIFLRFTLGHTFLSHFFLYKTTKPNLLVSLQEEVSINFNFIYYLLLFLSLFCFLPLSLFFLFPLNFPSLSLSLSLSISLSPNFPSYCT